MMMGVPDLRSNLAAHLDAVATGQHEVEQDQVGIRGPERLEGERAVGAEERLEAVAAQHDADHLGEGRVIVDDQNACAHQHQE